jgi:hypothetical protein
LEHYHEADRRNENGNVRIYCRIFTPGRYYLAVVASATRNLAEVFQFKAYISTETASEIVGTPFQSKASRRTRWEALLWNTLVITGFPPREVALQQRGERLPFFISSSAPKVWVVAMTGKHPKRNERPGVDRAGRTLLHYAAADGDGARVKELLALGMDSGGADDDGWTPLHFAAQKSAVEVVQLLVKAGATVDPRDAHGNTPLFRAVFNSRGNGEVVKLLRESGADPFAKNVHGVSPLKLARTIANYDVRQFFSDLPDDDDAGPSPAPDCGVM